MLPITGLYSTCSLIKQLVMSTYLMRSIYLFVCLLIIEPAAPTKPA